MKKFILVFITVLLFVSSAFAEDIWILCQPDSYVNIRPFASKKQEPCGIMECGWDAITDGTSKNGYLLVYTTSTEAGSGWIKKGYIVYSKPVVHTYKTNIYSKGRVACWRAIGGNRRCWVKNGDCVTVYATSEEWAVTNKGFIKTKYLGIVYETLLQDSLNSEEMHWEDE